MRGIPILGALIILTGCAHSNSNVLPEDCEIVADIVLVVWSRSSSFATYGKFFFCEGDECWPHTTWFVHDARVLGVITGDFPARSVRFAIADTQLEKRAMRPWYVAMEQIEDSDLKAKVGTPYIVLDYCLGDAVVEGIDTLSRLPPNKALQRTLDPSTFFAAAKNAAASSAAELRR